MTVLGVAVIGTGAMGARHAENIARSVPDARLIAVHDADAGTAARVATSLGCAQSPRVDDLLARDDVQAVVIASPPRFHVDHAVATARAGKHVFLEKPMALTLVDAEAIIAATEAAGVALQIGFMRRYDPAYAAAKAAIQRGDIGEPVLFRGIDRDADAPSGPAGSLPRAAILTDSAIHDFDVARWLMADEVVAVRATVAAVGDPRTVPCPNVALVDLRFARGAIGNIEALHGARYGYDIRAEIVGTEGTLLVGGQHRTALQVLTVDGARHDLPRHWLERFADAYVAELRDFLAAVQAGGMPAVTGADGRRALAIALAADVAGAGGAEVTLA